MEAADAADAETNTTTIHLLRDQTEDVTINNTKHSPTLNLNGYTLTGHITVTDLNKADLTFTLCNAKGEDDYNLADGGGKLTSETRKHHRKAAGRDPDRLYQRCLYRQ